MNVIEASEITKVYSSGALKVDALAGVSLQIQKGEFVAIMGSSGSGKSTLMNIIGLLDRPTKGAYSIDGLAAAKLKEPEMARIRNRKIGFVFQTFNLLNRHTAIENVELPLIYAGLKNTKDAAAAALEEVGLSHRARHKPNQLSGGERQRVAIARAIVLSPPLILADEPTGNLDSKTGVEIMRLFKDLNKKGATVVIVTHENDIAAWCKRVVHIRDGQIFKDIAQIPNTVRDA